MLTKVPIKHFAKVGSGQGAPQRETDFSETGIPFIRAGSLEDLLNGREETDLPKVNEEIAKEYRLKLYQPNTIVFAKSGMSALKGRIYKLKNPCYVVNHLATLELKENAIPDYVIYTLRYFSPVKLINDNAYPSLKQSVIENYEIPFPKDKDAQLHIANILSKAENLIAQRKESIRLLDEFLKSTFWKMFGEIKGERVPLTSACILNPKKSEISEIDKTIEVSFVPMANVSEKGEVNLSQTKPLESIWNGFTYFKEDDVVFAKITPCMENGKGAIMKNLKNKIGFGTTEFHVLRPIDGISTSVWLYYLTAQDSFRKKAEQNMTGSAGQKRVPPAFFEKYKVIVPPIELQTQFAQIVEKTEALKSQYQQSLQELENLYGSLSQKAFRGELTKK